MHTGSDYRALRDIDDAREITAFEHTLNIIGHPGLKSCKWNIKLILRMRGKSPPSWTYIKEMHTNVIGNKHQGQFTEPFFQGWSILANLEATVGTYELRSYGGERQWRGQLRYMK